MHDLLHDQCGIGILRDGKRRFVRGRLVKLHRHILHTYRQRLIRVCHRRGGRLEIGETDVFQGKFAQMGAALKRSVIRGIAQYVPGVFNDAVFQMNIRWGMRVVRAGKIHHRVEKIVPALFSGKLKALASDHRFSVRIIAGAIGIHILDADIDPADAEQIAGGIQHTASHQQILDVDARDAVVSRFEQTILDQRILGAVKMNAVRAAEAGHAAHRQIFAIVGLVQKIAAVPCRVSLKEDILTAGEKDGMRSAVALFSVGIVTIGPVDHRARLSDDREFFLAVSGDDRSAVGLPRRAVILGDQLHIRAHLHTRGDGKHLVIVAVVASVKLGAALQIERRVGVHIKCRGIKAPARNDHRPAALQAEIKDRLYF